MKTMRKIMMLVAAALAMCAMQGCYGDDDTDSIDEINQRLGNDVIQALVTTKTAEDGTFYLQESEKRLLHPINFNASPYGDKEVRCIVYYTEAGHGATNQTGMVDVYVKWIDDIYTLSAKAIEEALATPSARTAAHPIEIEIVYDWVNSLTDGYLTLHYHTERNDMSTIYLLTGQNPDDPYEVSLWPIPALSNSDTRLPSDGLIAYKIDNLPPTNGEVKIVTLRWYSPSGWKQAQFYYQTK